MLHKPKFGFVAYIILIAFICLIFMYALHLDEHFSSRSKNVNDRIPTQIERPPTKAKSLEAFPSLSDDYEKAIDDEYCPRSTEALRRLRSLMKNNTYVLEPLDAYIVLYQDAHQNEEFIADKDRRIQFLSGFTGEYGTVMVTEEHAYLLTNYENQAELDGNWTVVLKGDPGVASFENWFSNTLPEGAKIGFHSLTMTYRKWSELQSAAQERNQTLVPINEDLVDLIWTNRTSVSGNTLIPLELYFSGETSFSKIERLRAKMSQKGATICLVQSLEEVAWTVNVRGSDIPYLPVFFSYLLVTPTTVHLFVEEGKITPALGEHFKREKLNVLIHLYTEALPIFIDIVNSDSDERNKVWLARDTSYAFVSAVAESKILFEDLPIALMKAIKNKVEIEGFVNAHVKDAAAFCCFFAWLEKQLSKGDSSVTELTAAKQLEKYRRKQVNYLSESFPTVSATGAHAAILHYRVTPETDRLLNTDEMYLCDAGAHYKDGTTDVTRTVHFGTPSDYQKECFTRVLKGQIQLRTSTFPENTRGDVLDAFARKYLWDAGLEYFHSTGHGIGTVLNVHESPLEISKWVSPDADGLQENMLLSNVLTLSFMKNKHVPVIIRMTKHSKKEEITKESEKKQPTAQIYNGDKKINHHLTMNNQNLAREACQLQNHDSKFVQSQSNGRVFARKEENSPVHKLVKFPLVPHQSTKNEPGYYENGEFGIRIENVLRTIPVQTKYSKRYLRFLTFEDLTLVPIQTSTLLNTTMLTKDEIRYINEYHAKCREKVAPLLQAEEETDGLAWLMKETESI